MYRNGNIYEHMCMHQKFLEGYIETLGIGADKWGEAGICSLFLPFCTICKFSHVN